MATIIIKTTFNGVFNGEIEETVKALIGEKAEYNAERNTYSNPERANSVAIITEDNATQHKAERALFDVNGKIKAVNAAYYDTPAAAKKAAFSLATAACFGVVIKSNVLLDLEEKQTVTVDAGNNGDYYVISFI